uniref:solute carrier family 23 member 1 n=1 Tax=Ciona intestinalis TaxID=7719 RepID=UPI000180C148|nr:solute carrier family 23 member 1 [Ciona intestinalis]|eukprot:XP_002124192.1 solute carrier family 23 member 1 [Ciona intestinalis]
MDGVDNTSFVSNEIPRFSSSDDVSVSDLTSHEVDDDDSSDLLYKVDDAPAWYACVAFGIQHYLVALGGMVGLPLLLAGPLCIPNDDDGDVARAFIISTVFFVAGICTMLQTTFGIRLPIMQGGTFSFLPPTLAILSLPHNKCPPALPSGFNNVSYTLYNDTDGSIIDGTEVWQRRIREVQGAIAVSSCLQILLGLTGAIGFLLRFIGPLTIAPAVALIGLDLFSTAYGDASTQWGIAMFTSFVLILCSQYLKNVNIPFPHYSMKKKFTWKKAPIFKMFPVLFALVLAWLLCLILTECNALPSDPDNPAYKARTDIKLNVLYKAPWFRFPYPGQWGLPRVTLAGVIGMMAGVVAGIVESIGDYYACARLSGAPNPPTHAINRGILMEGFGCLLAGVIGTSTATTSFSENIGAIGITRVGSRRVLQVAGFIFFILGMLSKFGSIFVTIPDPVIGGLFCVMFGMIAAVGLSNLQYVDLNSPRNLFIIGFSIFMGLTVPEWMKANQGVIQTGVMEIDQILSVLLETSMLVGGILALVFDNTIPGTESERGIVKWRNAKNGNEVLDEKTLLQQEADCYKLPFPTNCCRFSRYIPILPEFMGRYDGDVEKGQSMNFVTKF